MARLDTDRQNELEPQRIEFAVKQIEKLGYTIDHRDTTKICFQFNGKKVTLFPYSGWHSGGSIVDGRGIDKLLKQITPKK